MSLRWGGGRIKFLFLLYYRFPIVHTQSHQFDTYLFIDHELEGTFWGDLEYIDSIAPPQRQITTLLHHVAEPTRHVDVVFTAVELASTITSSK